MRFKSLQEATPSPQAENVKLDYQAHTKIHGGVTSFRIQPMFSGSPPARRRAAIFGKIPKSSNSSYSLPPNEIDAEAAVLTRDHGLPFT